MRKAFVAMGLLVIGTAALSQQNSTTSCYNLGGSLQCNTQTQPDYGAQSRQMWQQFYQNQQQQQEEMQRNTLNAMAIAAQRQRERKAAEQAQAQQAQQAAIIAAANAAMAADTATAEPAPADEKAVMLVCTTNGQPIASLALYEKHNRLDVTTNKGVTKTRVAVFTPTAVTWHAPVWDIALNRLDGSFLGTPNIAGVQQLTGSCSVAPERKF